MSCNKNCCSMIDDLLEEIQSGLGKVDYDKIDEYIDERIDELKAELINGDIEVNVDIDKLMDQLKEALKAGDLVVDAYNVTYKTTNVGKKLEQLDELLNMVDGFSGKFENTLRTFTVGEVVYNTPLYFSFTKPVKELTASIYVNDMNTSTVRLNPTDKKFEIPVLASDTQIVIKAISYDDEIVELTAYANFCEKYYVGCCGSERISNKETLALNSYFVYPNVTKYSHIFHPIGKQYLWWAFPVDLHTDYDFFNNGLMDSNYVWTTGNLTNEYGYTSTYIFIRSGNPHTSSNIYTEVKAHEHK